MGRAGAASGCACCFDECPVVAGDLQLVPGPILLRGGGTCQVATWDRQWCRLRHRDADVVASPRIRQAPIRQGPADSNTGSLGSLGFGYGGRASLLARVEDSEGLSRVATPETSGMAVPGSRIRRSVWSSFAETSLFPMSSISSVPSGSWMVAWPMVLVTLSLRRDRKSTPPPRWLDYHCDPHCIGPRNRRPIRVPGKSCVLSASNILGETVGCWRQARFLGLSGGWLGAPAGPTILVALAVDCSRMGPR